MDALQARSQARFERARDQLQTLLGAGEINKLDAQLSAERERERAARRVVPRKCV